MIILSMLFQFYKQTSFHAQSVFMACRIKPFLTYFNLSRFIATRFQIYSLSAASIHEVAARMLVPSIIFRSLHNIRNSQQIHFP